MKKYYSLYAHLNTIEVNEGQYVYKGKTRLGGCGNTGTSAVHLHGECFWDFKSNLGVGLDEWFGKASKEWLLDRYFSMYEWVVTNNLSHPMRFKGEYKSPTWPGAVFLQWYSNWKSWHLGDDYNYGESPNADLDESVVPIDNGVVVLIKHHRGIFPSYGNRIVVEHTIGDEETMASEQLEDALKRIKEIETFDSNSSFGKRWNLEKTWLADEIERNFRKMLKESEKRIVRGVSEQFSTNKTISMLSEYKTFLEGLLGPSGEKFKSHTHQNRGKMTDSEIESSLIRILANKARSFISKIKEVLKRAEN